MDQFSDQHTCRFHVVIAAVSKSWQFQLHILRRHFALAQFARVLFVKCRGYAICAVHVDSQHAAVWHFHSPKYYVVVCQISPSCTEPDAAPSSVKHLVFVLMLKHKRVVETEFLSSGSPQGLSSPLLVVIFLSCHWSLLCSPSFLIILSAIYQTMKSERKKKIELVVSLHYGLCQVFWGKMFCVFSLYVP